MKIGICDDERIIIETLTGFIKQSLEQRKAKAKIIPFISGHSFHEKISGIDAVFLDISMPEMDGFEVGACIKHLIKCLNEGRKMACQRQYFQLEI